MQWSALPREVPIRVVNNSVLFMKAKSNGESSLVAKDTTGLGKVNVLSKVLLLLLKSPATMQSRQLSLGSNAKEK